MFEGRIRFRVNGIIFSEGKLLLVEIKSPTSSKPFWMPPGGGVNFSEPATDAVVREVKEETGLSVSPLRLLYVSEYINQKWHALEFYYMCEKIGGVLKLGTDPELLGSNQMLKDARWFDLDEALAIYLVPRFLKDDLPRLFNGDEFPLRFFKQ